MSRHTTVNLVLIAALVFFIALGAAVIAVPGLFRVSSPAPRTPVVAAPAAAAKPEPPPDSVWNERALFLAGLPAAGPTPLAALRDTAEWKDFKAAIDADWKALSERLDTMREWARAELDPRIDPRRPLIYMFGGPDAVTAMAFFPEAASYFQAGLEPLGEVAPPESLPAEEIRTSLETLSSSLRTAVKTGFFRTSEMGQDLSARPGREIRGVLPILLLFAARSGRTVLDVQRVEIDRATGEGTLLAEGQRYGQGIPSVTLVLARPGSAAPQSLTYVRMNVQNGPLAKSPGYLAFLKRFAPGNVFLKAAQFILDDNTFSIVRAALIEDAAAVLQDDSGIPFRLLKPADWSFTFFGTYQTPRPPFARNEQPDLKAAFEAQPSRPLPFKIGYRRLQDSNLTLAVRKTAPAGE